MTAFIATWDGRDPGYGPSEYQADIDATAAGVETTSPWSMGGRRSGATTGDKVYLLRQRTSRGIIACGRLADGRIYPGPHWDPERSDEEAFYADVIWEKVLPIDQRLPIEELQATIPEVNWTPRRPGQKLEPPADAQLADRWSAHLR